MNVDGKAFRAIWPAEDMPGAVRIIDQRVLPHTFKLLNLSTLEEAIQSITRMAVRGAPLIGATGAYALYIALYRDEGTVDPDLALDEYCKTIAAARPTAVNLAWAVERVRKAALAHQDRDARIAAVLAEADAIADLEVENCRNIGRHGAPLISEIHKKTGRPVNILTHCNAGWLACVDVGTATAPIYTAHDQGVPVHVWVDETRPLNQGSRLTAWELSRHGVPHTVIVDNAGGHLMQHGQVDLVIVGSDRTTCTGDVANKIGTYLKALAARDNGVPFYAALPSSTIDWEMEDGVAQIPIEERSADEVRFVAGLAQGKNVTVLVPPEGSPAGNPAFDVTPSRLVTGIITERGLCPASKDGILGLFPEKRKRD